MNNVTPFTRTELLKLIAITTLTQVAKLAFKAGNTADDIVGAALEADYTRQGAYNAIRSAGHRTRKERSDKGSGGSFLGGAVQWEGSGPDSRSR